MATTLFYSSKSTYYSDSIQNFHEYFIYLESFFGTLCPPCRILQAEVLFCGSNEIFTSSGSYGACLDPDAVGELKKVAWGQVVLRIVAFSHGMSVRNLKELAKGNH